MAQGNNQQSGSPGINEPVVVDATGTRGFAVDYIIDGARPVLCQYTLDITCDGPEWGLIEARIGLGPAPAFVVARFAFEEQGVGVHSSVQVPMTFLVPAGWTVQMVAVAIIGTPVMGFARLIETRL